MSSALLTDAADSARCQLLKHGSVSLNGSGARVAPRELIGTQAPCRWRTSLCSDSARGVTSAADPRSQPSPVISVILPHKGTLDRRVSSCPLPELFAGKLLRYPLQLWDDVNVVPVVARRAGTGSFVLA